MDLESLRRQLNLETAPFPWRELMVHFASGTVIYVDQTLDLIDVAAAIASDDREQVLQWMDKQIVAKVSDMQAQAWFDDNVHVWTVVVKPWILVQLRQSKPTSLLH